MALQMAKRLLLRMNSSAQRMRKRDSYRQPISGVQSHFLSQHSSVEKEKAESSGKSNDESLSVPGETRYGIYDRELIRDSPNDDDDGWKWKLETAWLSKALEPALQLYKWASSAGNGDKHHMPSSDRSFTEILTNIQRSKIGIQDWSLSDFTVGLYLIYLSQSSARDTEFKGIQVLSDATVEELIYHLELAKGAYKDNATSLARHSMLRERNVLKFVKHSSVMRPGYYIAIDPRNKLVVFGIRGTHTVYDLITDVVSSSDKQVSFEGFSSHFGTAEAARWYLHHELGTIRKCLEKHKGYKLRLVGHSLGGAAASLLAIMLRKRSADELGFNPNIVSAVGFGTPPCLSKELAESCTTFVSTVVLQDDIVPRLSTFSLTRLRKEILETDWMTILEKEDWKGIVDLVVNAKQVVSSVQDVARRLADYAKLSTSNSSESSDVKSSITSTKPHANTHAIIKQDNVSVEEELFVPGTFYYLKRTIDNIDGNQRCKESYSLWKRHPDEQFKKIVVSGNALSDHRCESHYYALRDVLKSLPVSPGRAHLSFN